MHRCVPPRMPPRCFSYPLTLGLHPSVESSKIWHGAFCINVKETKEEQGPMSEDAQMRLKTGATKGEVTKSDGSKPEPSEEDVKSHPRYI